MTLAVAEALNPNKPNHLHCRGIMPFAQRKKIVEKARSKGKKGKSGSGGSGSSEIVAGMQVCLRSSPIYHIGAIGFTTLDGVPRVGQLMEAAWSLQETCRFKIRTHQR